MKLKCRNKKISNIWLITIIILTAMTISMFLLLYDNNGINSTNEDVTIYEVKTTNELVEDSMKDYTNSNTSNSDILLIDKANSTHKAISTFSNVTIPSNIYLDEILFVTFIFFCIILFISLPDDWTLLNLKVRLNN